MDYYLQDLLTYLSQQKLNWFDISAAGESVKTTVRYEVGPKSAAVENALGLPKFSKIVIY